MDKWTPELWLTSNLAEAYEGTEYVTTSTANILLRQMGLLLPPPQLSTTTGCPASSEVSSPGKVVLFDVGTGLGQLVETYLQDDATLHRLADGINITCGDIDPSLVDAVKRKAEQKNWPGVEVKQLDALANGLPHDHFTHVTANMVYMLLPKPIDALKESIRVLRRGDTLAFTTWAHMGLFHLLSHAITLIPTAPNVRTTQSATMMLANGYWHDRTFVRETLESLGLTDIKIEAANVRHPANNPTEFAMKMRVVVMLMTKMLPEEVKKKEGWEIFKKIEEIMRSDFGDGPCYITSCALIVTAKKPEAS